MQTDEVQWCMCDAYLWVIQGKEKDLWAFQSSNCCHHWEIHREWRIWEESTKKKKKKYKKKPDSFSFLLPSKSTDSYQNSPGKNCMVGALSWIFLLILKERSGSSLPSLLMHSPASNDTPSMSSDTSRTFRTSTGATAKRQERWVGLIMAWIFRYLSSQPSQHLNYSSFRLKSDTLMMHAFYHNRTPACTAVCSAASVEWQTFDTVKSHVGKRENVCIATPSFIF